MDKNKEIEMFKQTALTCHKIITNNCHTIKHYKFIKDFMTIGITVLQI